MTAISINLQIISMKKWDCYNKMGLVIKNVLRSMNNDYLLSDSVLDELISKFAPCRTVQRKRFIFSLYLKKLSCGLHGLHFFCKRNGLVASFQNEYRSLLKNVKKR